MTDDERFQKELAEARANPQGVLLTYRIKRASDIVAVAGSYTELDVDEFGLVGACLFCAEAKTLRLDHKWQVFYCQLCGVQGDVFTFVMKAENVDFMEARAILAKRAGIDV